MQLLSITDYISPSMDVPAAIKEALKLYEAGELGQSVAVCNQILLVQPANADALHLLGLIAHKMGKNEAALWLIEKVISINDTNPLYYDTAGNLFRAVNKHDAAIACYSRAIDLNPDFYNAHDNLGIVLAEQGKLDEAMACFHRALAINPDFPDALNNLGNVFREKGEFEEAITLYRRALSLKPDYVEALYNLGNATKDKGNCIEAIFYYQRALFLNPEFPEALHNLGILLGGQGNLDEATACFHRALAMNPDFPEALNNLGNLFRYQGRPDEALDCLHRALTMKPDFPEALDSMGKVLQDLGKFEEAMDAYQKAISVNKNFTAAYLHITESRKFTETDGGFIETLRDMIEQDGIRDEDVINIRFALGKIYDDMGRFGDAFFNYCEANRLEDKKYKFDEEKHAELISRLIETFSPEFFRRKRHFGSDTELPVMVLGLPRSGTTLVEQIISSHPLVYGAGELEFWNGAARKDDVKDVLSMTADTASSIEKKYTDHLRALSNTARHITDKMPNNYLHIGLIHLIFPRARIIHVQRNPVDTCLSIYFHKFSGHHPYAYDLHNLLFYYKQYQRLMTHWRNVLPQEVFYEVKYEELIKEQENVSRELIKFCGLPWDEKCLEFYSTDRQVTTSSNWQVRQPIYKSSMARWKNYRQFLDPLAELLNKE